MTSYKLYDKGYIYFRYWVLCVYKCAITLVARESQMLKPSSRLLVVIIALIFLWFV